MSKSSGIIIYSRNCGAASNTPQYLDKRPRVWHNKTMDKNKKKKDGVTDAASENTPVVVEKGLTVETENGVSVAREKLPDRTTQPVAVQSSAPSDYRRVTAEMHSDDGDASMSGGFASVKSTHRRENGLIWAVVAVMCVMCIAVGICSSVLTAYFMRKGNVPPHINTEDVSQQIAAVVAARKPSVAEVRGGSLRGSGVITKYENGKVYLLTNNHVIAGGSVSVRLGGEDSFYEADVVGYNSYYDIAVVTVAHTPERAVFDLDGSEYFKQAVEYSEGDHVVAIGNAMAMGAAAYDGIISRSSDILKYNDKHVPVLRTTAAVNAGMSGGALFDMSGNFLGLTTYRMSSFPDGATHEPSNDVEDTAFVVPVSVVYPVYKQILGQGEPDSDMSLLGMTFFGATSTSAVGGMIFSELGITCEFRAGGLTVARVDSGVAPSEIAVGDVIAKIGGVAVTGDVCRTAGEFLRYRPNVDTGASVPDAAQLRLEIKRGGALRDVVYKRIYRYVGA